MRSAFLLLLLVTGCGETTAKRRTFDLWAQGAALTHANGAGWTVQLTLATARLGPVRFYTGKVLLSSRAHFDWTELFISSAYAHPGHYQPGTSLGEWLDAQDVDLLASAPTRLGTAQGVTGDYGSLELTLPAPGIHLRGTATKGAESVTFDTTAYVPSIPLEGIRFDQRIGTEAGHVLISVSLDTVLDRIDFSQAPPADPNGLTTFTSTDAAFNGYARGVLDTSAYAASWGAGAQP